MDTSRLFSGFSSPQIPVDGHVLDEIIVAYGDEYLRRFLLEFQPELEQTASGSGKLFREWLEGSVTPEAVWHISFGEITKLVRRDTFDCVPERVVGLILRLVETGHPFIISANLDRPIRLRLQNWLLPPAFQIYIATDGRSCELRLVNQDKTQIEAFDKIEGAWNLRSGDSVPLDSLMVKSSQVVVLHDDATSGFESGGFGAVERQGSEGWAKASLGKAVALLEVASPNYSAWVARVVRHIVPLKPAGWIIGSGSDPSQPGVVFSTPLLSSALAGEILVHEASHQYMHILTRLGRVDNGDDTPRYYSPVKKTMRPLWGIVAAFHAFGNVACFYKDILSSTHSSAADRAYCADQTQMLMPQLKELMASLENNASLSDVGRALVEPLFSTVHDH
jgi:hypothetical protein